MGKDDMEAYVREFLNDPDFKDSIVKLLRSDGARSSLAKKLKAYARGTNAEARGWAQSFLSAAGIDWTTKD
jgi:hypothetical protein